MTFKTLYNQAKVRLELSPVTPFLIKASGSGLEPWRPEMEFVTTESPAGLVEYIPGSSLKGVMRSSAERFLKALGKSICDPLAKNQPCQLTAANACDACRTFGSLKLAGRTRVLDGYPWKIGATAEEMAAGSRAIQREIRTNVAIDRQSGASKGGALFDLQVLVRGTFHPEVTLQNFTLWQLALIGFLVQQIDEGFSQVGYGKSRGLGHLSCKIAGLEVRQFGALAARPELAGADAAGSEGTRDRLDLAGDLPASTRRGFGAGWDLDAPAAARLFEKLAASEVWTAYATGKR